MYGSSFLQGIIMETAKFNSIFLALTTETLDNFIVLNMV